MNAYVRGVSLSVSPQLMTKATFCMIAPPMVDGGLRANLPTAKKGSVDVPGNPRWQKILSQAGVFSMMLTRTMITTPSWNSWASSFETVSSRENLPDHLCALRPLPAKALLSGSTRPLCQPLHPVPCARVWVRATPHLCLPSRLPASTFLASTPSGASTFASFCL